MKKLCYFISFLFLLLTFAGCENDGTLNENSEIVVVGLGHKVYNLPLGNEILFTGNDIKWFNSYIGRYGVVYGDQCLRCDGECEYGL